MQTVQPLPLRLGWRPRLAASSVSTSLSMAGHGLAIWLAATLLVQPAVEAPRRVVVHIRPPSDSQPAGPAGQPAAAAVIVAGTSLPVPPAPVQTKPKPKPHPRATAAARRRPVPPAVVPQPMAVAPAVAPTPAARVAAGPGFGLGSGAAAQGAAGQGASSGSGSGTDSGSERAGYLGRVRAAIENAKRYPLLARRRGIEGRAAVAFELSPAGEPRDVVVESADHPLLAAAARAAVEAAAPFPSAPAELGAQPIRIAVPLRFALEMK